MAQTTMPHKHIEIALFVMIIVLIGVNIWQTLRLEKAVEFCHQFVQIMTNG